MKRLSHHGDTLVEVLLAMTLLSAILLISWSIVNRSSQINLTSRQRIVMVNQLKEQAEILKSMYSNPATRSQVVATRTFGGAVTKMFATTGDIRVNPCDSSRSADGVTNAKLPNNAFYFDDNASVSSINATKTVNDYENAKTWIQMVPGSGYIDFYIQGCWRTYGGEQNEDNSRFIVRLNT